MTSRSDYEQTMIEMMDLTLKLYAMEESELCKMVAAKLGIVDCPLPGWVGNVQLALNLPNPGARLRVDIINREDDQTFFVIMEDIDKFTKQGSYASGNQLSKLIYTVWLVFYRNDDKVALY